MLFQIRYSASGTPALGTTSIHYLFSQHRIAYTCNVMHGKQNLQEKAICSWSQCRHANMNILPFVIFKANPSANG